MCQIFIQLKFAYLEVSWVVWTVEVKKSLHEYAKKQAATPIDAKTTATHPTLKGKFTLVAKYLQPCKLVQLQNRSKLEFASFFVPGGHS